MTEPDCYVCWIRADGPPNPASCFLLTGDGEVRPLCDACLRSTQVKARIIPFDDGIGEWTVLEVMRG